MVDKALIEQYAVEIEYLFKRADTGTLISKKYYHTVTEDQADLALFVKNDSFQFRDISGARVRYSTTGLHKISVKAVSDAD